VAGISLALAASLALASALGARPGRAATFVGVLVGVTGFLGSVSQLLRDRFTGVARWRRAAFASGIAGVFIGTVLALLHFQAPPPPLYRLTGTQNVAVVGFKAHGSGQDQRILDDVSATFALDLGKALPAATVRDYATEYSLPLTDLLHADDHGLDARTRKFVDQSNASILLGGIVTQGDAGQTLVRPAVYVRADHVTDAPELAGWYTGEQVPSDQGLQFPHSRAAMVSELVRRARGLAEFTDALDAWHAGNAALADRAFARLLHDGGSGGALGTGTGFVTPDLVHLFRGHALEDAATADPTTIRPSGLDAARAEYQAIPATSPIRLRAQLSLATNDYLRSLGPVATCEPGTVRAAGLARASATLRRLADDPAFTKLGRLKASVNLAQTELCRVAAGLAADDGTIDRALRQARSTRPIEGSRELQAFAASFAAQHEASLGRYGAAISDLRQALKLEPRFARRALWQAQLASWALEQCDLAQAAAAHRESLRQLDSAIRTGTAPGHQYDAYVTDYGQRLSAALAKCKSRSPR
jgi:tetratricopeptide (TPR) repeat protein/xanthosine utilization system XapX-like protein